MRLVGTRRSALPPERQDPDAAETGTRLVHVRVSEVIHRALRIHVASEDTSIQTWVAALIERELSSRMGDRFVGRGVERK